MLLTALSLSHTPSQPSSSKANSSLGTDTCSQSTSEPLVLRCSSSISIEQQLDHRHECALFARYLHHSGHRPASIAPLLAATQEILHRGDSLLTFPDLAKDSQDMEGRALSHFVGAWLLHMGYGNDKTRNYCLTRVKLLKASAVPAFARKYTDFRQLGLSRKEKQELLLKTCKNGWEYFIGQVLKLDQENSHAASNKARECEEEERQESEDWQNFISLN